MAGAQQMQNGAAPYINAVLDGPPSIPAGFNVKTNSAGSVVKPGFQFDEIGIIYDQGGSVGPTGIGQWWSMGDQFLNIPAIPFGLFYIRATLVSGVAPTSGTMNTWIQLNGIIGPWSNNVVRTSVIDFEIAADSAGAGAKGIGRFTINAT